MLKIKENGIPNTVFELTIGQFDKINTITADVNLDEIEKWIEKFVYLGADRDDFDDMELEEFNQLIQEWNNQPHNPTERIATIELDGYTYEAKESIGVKDLGMIEKVWKQQTGEGSAETLAIIFKRTDLTKKEHYAPAHIKHKMKLFKEQPSNILIPYITEVFNKLMVVTKELRDEATTELEGSTDLPV